MNRVLTILIAIALPMCPSREGTLGASGGHAGASQPGSALQSARMDALLAPWNTRDGPGAAVMVIHNGQVLHTKGYGLANRTRREPFRPDTASLIGSMAKQFTAMAIMLLAETGQLSYDDSLSRYFADLAPPTRRITIRHLLNHTSGLSEFEDFLEKTSNIDRMTPADVVLTYLSRELRFNPGDQWEYSNGGYVVLTHVVAKAAGKSYVEFVRERFDRLNMRNSFFAEEPTLATARRAIGYFREWYGLKISETLEPLRF